MNELLARLKRLETRFFELDQGIARQNRHLLEQMATQRETMTRALQQVQLTLTEQDVSLRSAVLGMHEFVRKTCGALQETVTEALP